jgi:DNA-binding transcriptional regulator YdaS (Cro superfamily)
MPNVQTLIGKAVESVGSQAKLATAAGCSQQLISQLLQGKVGITAETAQKIDAATNGTVSKHELRPDIFGTPPDHRQDHNAAA